MDVRSTWHRMYHLVMVTWTIFKNHFLEEDLTTKPRDHGTLIGGIGGAGPSSLPTTLEGPMEYVNGRWMNSLHIRTPTRHRMDHVFMVTRAIFQRPSLGGGPQHETGRPWHTERSQPLVYFTLSCVRTRMNKDSLKRYMVEGPVTYNFTLPVPAWPIRHSSAEKLL